MDTARLGFGARLALALKVLFDGLFAGKVHAALSLPGPSAEPEPEITPTVAEVEPAGRDYSSALQLLSILQREGRFVDFLKEDMGSYPDADIGAAARVVHEGCNAALKAYLEIGPVRTEQEGERVVLEPGFDPARNRVTGNVVGEPPFHGQLAHHGWRALRFELPTLTGTNEAGIIAPAEVEL